MPGKLDSWFHKYFRTPYRLSVVFDEGSGPAIIFIHGIASNSLTWLPLIPLLKDNYRCIAIDLLGFGVSPKPNWSAYTMDDHLKSLHTTIRHLKVDEPFIVMGHSMGSIIAAKYADRYPSEVRHLYMLSPPIVTNISSRKPHKIIFAKSSYARIYRYLREHKRFTITSVVYVKKFLKTTPFDLTEASWLPFVRSLEECIEKQRDIATDLLQVQCPVEIFYGTRDRVISSKNIESLAILSNVTIHPISSWHRLNKTYAATLARQMQ